MAARYLNFTEIKCYYINAASGSSAHDIEVRRIQEGVAFVSTPWHGYVHVDEERNQMIPEPFRLEDGIYEEDCEALKVSIFIKKSHNDETLQELNHWYKDQVKLWSEIDPVAHRRLFKIKNMDMLNHEIFSIPNANLVVMDKAMENGDDKNPMDLVPKFIFDQGGTIAGGCLIRWLMGIFDPMDNDIDVWFPALNERGNTNPKLDYVRKLLKKQGWCQFPNQGWGDNDERYDMYQLIRERWCRNGVKMDLLIHQFKDDIINHFDLNICMLGYTKKRGLYWNEHFLAGIKYKVIRNIHAYNGYNRFAFRRDKWMDIMGAAFKSTEQTGWTFQDMHDELQNDQELMFAMEAEREFERQLADIVLREALGEGPQDEELPAPYIPARAQALIDNGDIPF